MYTFLFTRLTDHLEISVTNSAMLIAVFFYSISLYCIYTLEETYNKPMDYQE
jgi:hypothetical protein